MNKLLHKSKATASDISVVICAYTEKRWDDLLAAVRSIDEQQLLPRELIVVIDHNRSLWQRANQFLLTMPHRSVPVQIIENSEQPGASGSRNSGIALAKGEIIACMDEDAVAEPDWLAQLAAAFADPQVMGVGGAIVPNWESLRPAWFPYEFDWVVGCTYRGLPTTTTPVRSLIACNMSCRRELFQMLGGFRQEIGRIGPYPIGCEETEFCIRAQQRWPEKLWLYEPRARVHHHVTPQRATWDYFRKRCYAEGLSKVLVTECVGTAHGLSAERAYTFRTLPQGVLQSLRDGCYRGDVGGFGRAAAIISGFAFTAAGYFMGRVHRFLDWREAATGQQMRTATQKGAL